MTPLDILRKYWGYDSFRPLQEDIIKSLLDGRDVIGLLPTGGGKSVCFQVPALMLDGICLVVSPLIALMEDQVRQLRERGIRAEVIHSGLRKSDIDRILDNCVYGNTKFLYLSPERLTQQLAQVRISKMQVSFVAIDEAHCVSQWGHDFRPAYLKIPTVRELHPDLPMMVLTATATPRVRDDIESLLHLRSPETYVGSFKRKNLSYRVYSTENKAGLLLDALGNTGACGIVYVRSRRRTSELTAFLVKRGIRAAAYHAGLPMEERKRIQDGWINDEVPVVVCTTAFGMGIDKSDVRSVVHYDLPPSLEEYYQEAGRAGRDGEPSNCVLLYHPGDVSDLKERIDDDHPPAETLRRTYALLLAFFHMPLDAEEPVSHRFNAEEFCSRYSLKYYDVFRSMRILQQEGWIALEETGYSLPTVQIKLSREELYNYTETTPVQGRILTLLLRMYEGVLQHGIQVRTGDLARRLSMTREDLDRQLRRMDFDGVISYAAPDDGPFLTFFYPRVAARNIRLNVGLLDQLKQRAVERFNSVERYIDADSCRQQVLAGYFGEEPGLACGVCDNCLRKNAGITTRQVLTAIPEDGIQLDKLVSRFDIAHKSKVVGILAQLERDGYLLLSDRIVTVRKNREQ